MHWSDNILAEIVDDEHASLCGEEGGSTDILFFVNCVTCQTFLKQRWQMQFTYETTDCCPVCHQTRELING